MTDEYDADHETPAAPGRPVRRTTGPVPTSRRSPARSPAPQPARLPRRPGRARRHRRWLLLRRHLGHRQDQRPVRLGRGLPRPGHAARSPSRSRAATPSPRWAATSRPPAWSPRSRPSSTPRTPTRSPTSIQVGYYPLKKEMAAADVVEVLVDPANLVKDTVTIPEGLRVERRRRDPREEDEVLEGRLQEGPRQPRRSSACPTTPTATRRATSSRRPTTSAPTRRRASMLTRDGRPAGARPPTTPTSRTRPRRSGYTPQELMTVASLVQAEGRGDDMPKIARVIYNRAREPRQRHDQRPAADRRDGQLRARPPGDRRADRRTRSTRSGLAVQHLHAAGPAAGADRGPGRRGDRGGRAPGRRRLVVLRHGQPRDRRDQVHRRLRRVPASSSRSSRTTAPPSPTAAERVDDALRRPG